MIEGIAADGEALAEGDEEEGICVLLAAPFFLCFVLLLLFAGEPSAYTSGYARGVTSKTSRSSSGDLFIIKVLEI